MFKMRIDSIYVKLIFMLFLGICAVFDMRKKEIPLQLILMGVITSFGISIYQVYVKAISVIDAVYSLIPGLTFILISFATKEKVGYGDGLILIVAGFVLGFYQCFFGLCISLVCSSVFSLLLLVLHKADKDSGLAFVPFLTIGMGVSFIV